MFFPKTFRILWQILLLTTFGFIQQKPIHAQPYYDSSLRKNVAKLDIFSGSLYKNAFNFAFERVNKKSDNEFNPC
jgi:hypothetical protein